MTAMHLSRTHAPCKDHRAWVGLLLIALGSLAGAAENGEQAPTITAVHKAQELSFNYRSNGFYYSCHEIEKRVAAFLIAVGARDDIQVSARNCDAMMLSSGDTSMDIDPTVGRGSNDPFGRDRDPFGRDRNDSWGRSGNYGRGNERELSAQVRIKLMMPVEVTPQILKEIERDKSRRDLVSRVTGNPAASMNDPIVFAARREEVTLSQRTLRGLQAEDCQLLQQLTQQVIRKLDVKVKHQSFGCGPRSSSRIPPQLTVETLLPTGAILPMPNPERKTTAPAEPGAEPGAGPGSASPHDPSGSASPPGNASQPEPQPAGTEPPQQ